MMRGTEFLPGSATTAFHAGGLRSGRGRKGPAATWCGRAARRAARKRQVCKAVLAAERNPGCEQSEGGLARERAP